jgi:hypothetical protein
VQLAAELGHGHESDYVLLYQLMDHGRILLGCAFVYTVPYLLLDVIDLGAPRSTDDDGSHAGDRRC